MTPEQTIEAVAAPPTRPSERSEERRRQILDAAECCFRRHGFHNASMAQLAEEARMSVGHIYRYFSGKDAIILGIVDRDLARLNTDMIGLRSHPDGLYAAFVTNLRRVVDELYDDNRAPMLLEILAEASRNPKVGERVRSAHRQVHTRFIELLTQDCGRPQDGAVATPEQRDRFFWNIECMTLMLEGLVLRAIRDPDMDRDVLAKNLAAFISNAVRGDPKCARQARDILA